MALIRQKLGGWGMSSELSHESETVELKKSLAELKEGLISMAAILNKHGAGELWFGVAPSGKACIHIRFDGQNAPYFAHGRAYMRVADEDRQLSAAELEAIIVDKNQNALRWDTRPLDKPWPDLITHKVKSFAKRAGLPWDALGDDDENRLQPTLSKLEVLQKGELCNAARLFFAAQPIQLRCAVFGTTDTVTIIDRHDFEGDILALIEEAQKYILKNIHIGMRVEGLYRVDVPEVSMEALREAIINAFCHRDWRDPDPVQVAIFKDRVEIRNPGKLYGGLTIADLHRGNVSQRRNPLIADLFRRIDMVESWGRGMMLIHQNAPAVSFKEVGQLFIASFARPSFGLNDQDTVERTVDKTVSNSNKPTLTAREDALLRLLANTPQMTQKQLADQLGLTERGVRYLTDKLQAVGVLQRQGGKKAGQWVVVQPGKGEREV